MELILAMRKLSSSTSKNTAKRKTAQKRVSKKTATRKTAKRKTAKRKIGSNPSGYSTSGGGLLIPKDHKPVPPKKIESGISKAKKEIESLMESLSDLTDGYQVAEIELAASFSADGKFLGIGVGGATTISIKFKPES